MVQICVIVEDMVQITDLNVRFIGKFELMWDSPFPSWNRFRVLES